MSFFSYGEKDSAIHLRDSAWDLNEWKDSAKKGPFIRPHRDHVVILQDPYPDKTGLIHHPDSSMDHVNHAATVLAVPEVTDKGFGFWRDDRFQTIGLRPVDRIVTIRFIAYERLPDPTFERLRTPRYDELWGLEA